MKSKRIAAMTTLAIGASVALAGPAYAGLGNGTYHVAGNGLREEGFEWVLSSCGLDCLDVDQGSHGQLHRQGGTWSGTTNAGCVTSIDDGALKGSYQCPMVPPIAITLTKTG